MPSVSATPASKAPARPRPVRGAAKATPAKVAPAKEVIAEDKTAETPVAESVPSNRVAVEMLPHPEGHTKSYTKWVWPDDINGTGTLYAPLGVTTVRVALYY